MTDMDYTKMVGRNIRRIAYENGKTQADMARDLHISKATISSWMNGSRLPRMDKIDLLCSYFNCRRIDIMEEQKEEPGETYYTDPETAQIAQDIFHNPELRILMDASRTLKPNNIRSLADLAIQLKETNPDG